MRFARFALGEAVRFCTERLWERVRIIDAMGSHELLELCGSRFACGFGVLKEWGGLWRDGHPLVQFLAEEVDLIGEENLSALELA